MIKKLTQRFRDLSFEKYIVRLLAAFCLSSLFFYITNGGLSIEKAASTAITLFALIFALFYVAVMLIGIIFKKYKNAECSVLAVGFFLYAALSMFEAESWYYSFGMAALGAVLIFYFIKNDIFRFAPVSSVKKWAIVAVFSVLFVLTVGGIAVYKYKAYSAPNYDFGIFCNMFYNMRKSFSPVTTCERDKLLSHFAVHVSPIFYAILPFYSLFPSPETLELVQSLILSSAVLPVVLIAKKYGLSNLRTLVMCFITLFHPAIICGTNYDLHENCFLYPLLLWVFYCFETERYGLLALFTALTLTVKEDAAIYIIFFSIYVFVGRRKHKTAVVLACGAIAWFFVALFLLTAYGEGVMSGRYENYLPNGGSLLDVVKNVLIDPGYVFTQLFVGNDGSYAAKLLFCLQIFAPFAFMPFAVKRISDLILILPMILLNLMPVYAYQYDIGFQYHFGVMAFMVYLSLINISAMEKPTAKKFMGIAAAATALLFVSVAMPRCFRYISAYYSSREMYAVMDEALEEIPDDASVICSTFLLPKLSGRDEIYEDYYHQTGENEAADYVILDMRYEFKEKKSLYESLGYTDERTVSFDGKDLLLIMQKE